MSKINKYISINISFFCLLLSSCSGITKKDFSDYVENDFCRTNTKSIFENNFTKVGQIKKIQPYDYVDGNLTTKNVNKIYPFDTSLIYILYASKKINNTSDIKILEDIIGPNTFKLHALFDKNYYYKSNEEMILNNLKLINNSYGTNQWINIEPELYNALKESYNLTIFSDGKFNLFIGELSDYWNEFINQINYNWDYAEETQDPAQTIEGKNMIEKLKSEIPSPSEINKVIEFDEINHSVKFNKYKNVEKLSISLAGIGKGILTDYIYQKLKDKQKLDGVCYAGSSSIITMNNQPYNDKWKVQLTNPYGIFYSPIGTLEFNGKMSISTSGSQINHYYTKINNQYHLRHHIINPSTGYPNTNYNQVTILSSKLSSSILDALSTILMNCDESESKFYVEKFRNYYQCDLECIFYKCANYNEEKMVKINVTKNLKINDIFKEIKQDANINNMPILCDYLEY